MESNETYDTIPLEEAVQTLGPDERGMMTELFYAFNTVITLQAFGNPETCRAAFAAARAACRHFERHYSRTLPHSDIARLNTAKGAPVAIAPDTAKLLQAASAYCANSEGCFDITMGTVVRLWDFHHAIIPEQSVIDAALTQVDWRTLRVWKEAQEAKSCDTGFSENARVTAFMEAGTGNTANATEAHAADQTSTQWWAQLGNPQAAVDVGGIAKGWIADRLTEIIASYDLVSFIVNLGGNVVAHGEKPDGTAWRIGLQDPRDKEGIVGAVAVRNASAVTSGVYERCFEQNGVLYHHILDPQTGYPVKTDVAGVTVLAQNSIDAEGYSTTLLALGIERGMAFVRNNPVILQAYFIDFEGGIHEA